MKAVVINGSPRKNGNTAELLRNAARGLESRGTETEWFHLYDLDYRGCISCFSCKRKGGTCNGLCAMRDGLTPVLEKILRADRLLLGSPIYFGDVTGMMRAFLERLAFPNLNYSLGLRSTFSGSVNSLFLYTMNVPLEQLERVGYPNIFRQSENMLALLNGTSEYLYSCDTAQFEDYSLYDATRFDPAHKEAVRRERFPQDCRAAFEAGVRLAGG